MGLRRASPTSSLQISTGVVTQDLNLRPRPPLQVLGLSKTPGQVGSQVRVSRKTQVRYRSWVLRDDIPSKKHPAAVSELSIVQQRKKISKILWRVVTRHWLCQSKTSTCEMQCAQWLGRRIQSPFQMARSGQGSRSGWKLPIPKDMKTQWSI
jgi:hypothetical protein